MAWMNTLREDVENTYATWTPNQDKIFYNFQILLVIWNLPDGLTSMFCIELKKKTTVSTEVGIKSIQLIEK